MLLQHSVFRSKRAGTKDEIRKNHRERKKGDSLALEKIALPKESFENSFLLPSIGGLRMQASGATGTGQMRERGG